MSRTARAAFAGSLVVAVGFGDMAGATAGDQSAADAAIAEFNARMLDAGWTSDGPLSTGEDDDDELDECLEGAEIVLSSTRELPAPGVTALAESDEFTFPPATDTTAPATSEPQWESDDGEFAGAVVLTVDDAYRDAIAGFVEVLGSKDTAKCVQDVMAGDLSFDTDDTTTDFPEPEVTAMADADLGIGDTSSRFEFSFEGEFFGEPLAFGFSFAAARTDRSLALVFYAYAVPPDERTSGFDPEAELEALVDSLDG